MDKGGFKTKALDILVSKAAEEAKSQLKKGPDGDSALGDFYDWLAKDNKKVQENHPVLNEWAGVAYGRCENRNCNKILTYEDNYTTPDWIGFDYFCSEECSDTAIIGSLKKFIDQNAPELPEDMRDRLIQYIMTKTEWWDLGWSGVRDAMNDWVQDYQYGQRRQNG